MGLISERESQMAEAQLAQQQEAMNRAEQIQQEELALLKQEDLNNKEAIAELYMMTMGGI